MHRITRLRRAASWLLALALVVSVAPAAAPPAAVAAPRGTYDVPDLKVAVVRSDETVAWAARRGVSSAHPHRGKEEALFAYLVDRGWDVVEIPDEALQDAAGLRKYDVVILPAVFAMKQRESLGLRRFVADGGGVVAAFGSPRVNPSSDRKWVQELKHCGWEWGPLSEAYQMHFINDDFTPTYKVNPIAHSITTGAKEILGQRGYSTAASGMQLVRSPGAGLELTRMLPGNKNVSRVANFDITTWSIKRRYPSSYPAITAAEYLDGRAVNFWFSAMDFLPTYNARRVPVYDSGLYAKPTSTGTPQGEVAAAYLESAIQWAAHNDGRRGGIVREGRTYAKVDAYNTGIYAHQYITNTGNVTLSGTLKIRIWDPSGRLVYGSTRYRHAVGPGHTQRISHAYRPGRNLKTGKYRVVVSYQYSFPYYDQTYREELYVKRGGARKAPTRMVGYRKPQLRWVTNSNPVITPNRDGNADSTTIRWSQNDWGWTSVKIYKVTGSRWQLVSVPLWRSRRGPQPRTWAFGFSGISTLTKKPLPAGEYVYSVQMENAFGRSSQGGRIVIKR